MRARTFLVATSMILSSSAAFAQQGGGTPAEKRACGPSVVRYCAKFVSGGDMSVLGCLQENRAKLRPACQKVLADHGV